MKAALRRAFLGIGIGGFVSGLFFRLVMPTTKPGLEWVMPTWIILCLLIVITGLILLLNEEK